jgi:hypothetical protein
MGVEEEEFFPEKERKIWRRVVALRNEFTHGDHEAVSDPNALTLELLCKGEEICRSELISTLNGMQE